ncbi:unnamed protein product, partial [Ectocarpus sp. 12 AP-2014]
VEVERDQALEAVGQLSAKTDSLEEQLQNLGRLLEEARERVSEKAQQLQHAERSWDEALNKSKDASATLVQDREARLVKANQDLEETKKDLELAREEAAAIAAELHREQEALSV